MNTTNYFAQLSWWEVALLIVALGVIVFVIIKQWHFFKSTNSKIKNLQHFFPSTSSLEIVKSSITKDVLASKAKLEKFILNPPPRYVPAPGTEMEETKAQDIQYTDVDLIKVRNWKGESFNEVIAETNAYLCKNVGTSADYQLLQDICERKLDVLKTEISNTVNVPLYLGLCGTFVGIILGLAGIATNVNQLFTNGNMAPLTNLLIGVVIAMFASLFGLGLMIYNSAVCYKRALNDSENGKNDYYDFLRRELMPTLSTSMASSLNSLKSVLGSFVGKFGRNLQAYADSAELLNDNIEKQHLLLVEINKMKEKEIAVEIAQTFDNLKDASDSLKFFREYQDDLNDTVKKVEGSTSKIDDIIKSFDDFSKSLKIVVQNQESAGKLQEDFRAAIETHFPTGSEGREMWRKEFDNLTTDASKVSEELNNQLKASTEYIKQFVDNNKEVFESMGQLKEVIKKLVEYTNVQATCYEDLKNEITELKKEQIESQKNSTKLNSDLLTAVREMVSTLKTIKSR